MAKDGKVLSLLGCKSKVLPGSLTDLSAWLGFCHGLDVQNPTQGLKSAKDLGNTFDLNLQWERTFPSFGIVHGICML
jgi:hypothetical protein